MHSCMYTNILIYNFFSHMCLCILMYRHVCRHIHTHTHTHTHTHAHTHFSTYTYMHLCIHMKIQKKRKQFLNKKMGTF